LYEALRSGVADGEENTWSNIETQNLDDVQPYIVQSDHGYLGYALVINQAFFSSLPPDLRDVVLRAADEATEYNRQIAFELNQQARRTIEERGTARVTDLTADQRRAFRDAVVPSVWQEYADVIGADLVRSLLRNVDRTER
jgi:C4-dicarboxylate-binding protein DctP